MNKIGIKDTDSSAKSLIKLDANTSQCFTYYIYN